VIVTGMPSAPVPSCPKIVKRAEVTSVGALIVSEPASGSSAPVPLSETRRAGRASCHIHRLTPLTPLTSQVSVNCPPAATVRGCTSKALITRPPGASPAGTM